MKSRAGGGCVDPSPGAWPRFRPLPDGHCVGADVLPLMKTLERRILAGWKSALVARWPELVGPKFEPHLRPGRFDARAGHLAVYANHPMYRFEATRELRDLAERIRQTVPKSPVRTVSFESEP